MNKANQYFRETVQDILDNGQWSDSPRTKWKDGTPANFKSIFQRGFMYDIEAGEFPINTYRPTALKGGFYDIEAIYIKQTNIIQDMHPMIQPWWTPHIVEQVEKDGKIVDSLSLTYGAIIRRWGLMDKTLSQLEASTSNRRILMNMWQEEAFRLAPTALPPCVYATKWNTRVVSDKLRLLDITMFQRSQDVVPVFSINPAQYTMLGMMVANHLTWATGVEYRVGKLFHPVDDLHIYDRHIDIAKGLIEGKVIETQPKISLNCEPKNFYEHTVDDFTFEGLEDVAKADYRLEIAE